MNDYTEVQIDVCAEEICDRLGVDYDKHRNVVSSVIEEHFGDRLRTPEDSEVDY